MILPIESDDKLTINHIKPIYLECLLSVLKPHHLSFFRFTKLCRTLESKHACISGRPDSPFVEAGITENYECRVRISC